MMNEYDEMEIAVTDGERDVLFELLSDEYHETHVEYLQAVQEWYANMNDATDDRCSIISERLTDIENLLTKLGFDVQPGNTAVHYKAMTDG